MSDKTSIYRVSNCTLSLSTGTYPVGSFRLYLPENGIPSITIGFDTNSISSTEGSVDTKSASVADYFNLYAQAQEACDERRTASFSMVLEPANKDGERQVVELSDWICDVAAFNRFTASGGIVFGLTLKHPAYKLYRSTSNLINIDKTQLLRVITKPIGDNPVHGLIESMERYANQVNTDAGSGAAKIQAIYKGIIKEAKNVFDWSECRWPDTGALSEINRGIRASIFSYVANVLSSSNPFRSIVDNMFSDWFLTAKPTYEDKLKVSPFNPWAAPKYSISVDTISDFNFPSDESDPLTGTYLAGRWLTPVSIGMFSGKEGKPDEQTQAYVTLQEDSGVGSIQRYNLPSWAEEGIYLTVQPSMLDEDKNTTPSNSAYGADAATPTITPKLFERYRSFIQRICDTLFITKYKSTTSIAIATPIMINKGGIPLLPGNVCEVIDDKGKPGLRFYITDVVHIMDLAGKQARTEIQGRFVRMPGALCLGSPEQNNRLYT